MTIYKSNKNILVSHRPLCESYNDGQTQKPDMHLAFGVKHSSFSVQEDPSSAEKVHDLNINTVTAMLNRQVIFHKLLLSNKTWY